VADRSGTLTRHRKQRVHAWVKSTYERAAIWIARVGRPPIRAETAGSESRNPSIDGAHRGNSCSRRLVGPPRAQTHVAYQNAEIS